MREFARTPLELRQNSRIYFHQRIQQFTSIHKIASVCKIV